MGWEDLSYYAFRLAGALAPHIPPRLAYRLAGPLGTVIYRLSPLRCNVEDNVSHVLGEPIGSPHVQRIARRIFANQCRNYFDLLRVSGLSAAYVRKAVRQLSGVEHVDHALSRGHGLVLVSAHAGNIDLAGQILAVLGYRVTAVAEHLRPERLFDYVRRARESHGLTFIPSDGSLRPVFRALRANEIVGLALDRNVSAAGRLVDFFGRPARLPDGYLSLALRTQAALVLAFCRRRPDNTFSIEIEPEVELARSGDLERDIATNMPRALALFEGYLRRNPDQWVLFQRVWEPSQPDAAPAPGNQVPGRGADGQVAPYCSEETAR